QSWGDEGRCTGASKRHPLGRAAAEIGLAHAIIVSQGCTGAAGDDRSRLQHVTAARSLKRIACVLLDQEDTRAGSIDRLDRAENVLDDHRREPERGLVETDEVWFCHDRAPKGEHLLLAPRQGAGVLAPALAQPRKHVEDLIHETSHLRALFAVFEGAELEIFAHREEREHAPPLGNERNPELAALIRWQARDVVPAEMD